MTFVGKVLVFMQVALSICFMAFAGAVYTVQQSWRAETEKFREQFNTAQNKLTAAEQRLTTLEANAATAASNAMAAVQKLQQALPQNPAAQDALQQIQALPPVDQAIALLSAQSEYADRLVAENSTLKTQVGTIQETLNSIQTERDQLQVAKDRAQEEAIQREIEAKANRERVKELRERNAELVAQTRQLENQIFSLGADIRDMNRKQEGLLSQLADSMEVLTKHGLTPDPQQYAEKLPPPPEVQGRVVNTREGGRGKSDLVEVSLGSDDGLQQGHELYAYRADGDGRYLGRIQIIFVTPDRAVGYVTQRVPNGKIEKDDHVTTKL